MSKPILLLDDNKRKLRLVGAKAPHKQAYDHLSAEFLTSGYTRSRGNILFPLTLHTALLVADAYDPKISEEVLEWIRCERQASKMVYAPRQPSPAWRYLRPYQVNGSVFLLDREGALLADAVGLGKTIQAVVAGASLQGQKLVICPNSLKTWWTEQIIMYTPNDTILTCGQGRNSIPKDLDLKDFEWVIIHWDVIRTAYVQSELKKINWGAIIADEAHRIKNRDTKTAQALKRLVAKQRWALTAMPYANIPADMFSILQWLDPKKYTSYWKFYALYVNWIPSDYSRTSLGPRNERMLAWELKDVFLRRELGDVYTDLPEIERTTIRVKMDMHQALLYGKLRKEFLTKFGNGSPLVISNAVARTVRLRQAVTMPRLLGYDYKSPKLEAVEDLLAMDDSPAVVVSTFRGVARELASRDPTNRATYVGGSDPENVSAFTCGDKRVLVGTIAALGEGFNLQRANTIIFVDLPWSLIQWEQTKGRIRPGMFGRKVRIIDIAVQNTIDDAIRKVLDHKLAGSQAVYDAIVEAVE